jgi:hypothetical protein
LQIEMKFRKLSLGLILMLSCHATALVPYETDLDRSQVTRRSFWASSSAAGAILFPLIANAEYGASASMELPNYIDFLIEKSKTVDPNKTLYKGADRDVQLKRVAKAAKRLQEIPDLAEKKKWSEITGILTGPLGELLQTFATVSLGNPSPKVKDAAKNVKQDLYEIGTAASKKDGKAVKKATDKALKDLQKFIDIAF